MPQQPQATTYPVTIRAAVYLELARKTCAERRDHKWHIGERSRCSRFVDFHAFQTHSFTTLVAVNVTQNVLEVGTKQR